jgi:hypothetical protein
MRNILGMIVVAVLLPAAASVSAEQPGRRRSDQPAAARPIPIKRAGAHNPCAAFGADFVKVEGTETCVRVGGAISIGAGGSVGRR